MCALSNRNKVTLSWVPVHNWIQSNEDADALARKGLNILLLGPKPANTILLCADRHKKHSKYWAATPGLRQSKLFFEGPSEKLSRHKMALNR
jgi:ribonuclease HI